MKLNSLSKDLKSKSNKNQETRKISDEICIYDIEGQNEHFSFRLKDVTKYSCSETI